MTETATTQPPYALSSEEGIAERIKRARKALDLTVEDLSAATALFDVGDREGERGVSVPTLYRYEANGTKPGARELRLLCFALNISPNMLLLGEEWDRDQEQDSRLARHFRELLVIASGIEPLERDGGASLLRKTNGQRAEWHASVIDEVKRRRRSP